MNLVGRTFSPEELEEMADELLADDLKNKKRNKTKLSEYPVLSEYQMERRKRKEIPFSCLGVNEKIRLGIRVDPD